MILKAEPSKQAQFSQATSSLDVSGPPPPFEESTPLVQYDSAAPPPPKFSLYEANFSTIGNGNIVSHDPHLNKDGEALYRFLLSHSGKPGLLLHCHGSHTERRSRWVTRHENGKNVQTEEIDSHTVVDFDFAIDVGQYILPDHHTWSIPDDEPAYRGNMVREVEDSLHQRCRPTRKVLKEYTNWRKHRAAKGLSPWAQPLDNADYRQLRSSHTLREWADDYCRSPKYLKEWVYEKTIYGWDFDQLESAVRAAIASTYYSGDVRVSFIPSANKVYIRPDNRLSRCLSNKWLKFLLIILCIYPFIWLFRRFHSRGGGRWEICGEAYALKRAEEQEAGGSSSVPDANHGKVLGLREGEFFKQYEDTIIRAVNRRYQTTTPLESPNDGRSLDAARLLDGY